MKPNNFPAGIPKKHFFGLSMMLYFRRLANVSFKSEMSVSFFLDITAISSTYACTLHPSWSWRQRCIVRWYVAPAFFNPKGIVIKQKVLKGVMNEVLTLSDSFIGIW